MAHDSRHRATNRWLLLGVVAALCNLGGLEIERVLHYAVEEACEAQETGDVTTCFLCSHFSFVPGEFVGAEVPPLPAEAGILEPPLPGGELLEQPAETTDARAPPAHA